MVLSRLSVVAAAAAVVLWATGASAADACKAAFDDYGDPNASVACDCPALSAPGIIYGTLIYTSDSDICTAARHAGQIDAAAGTVKLPESTPVQRPRRRRPAPAHRHAR